MDSAQTNIKLYSVKCCHLCELAEEILLKLGIEAIKIDIVDDDDLFGRYGLRIPVLKRADNDAELDWPFDAASVSRFLGSGSV